MAETLAGSTPVMLTCAVCVPRRRKPAPVISCAVAVTPGSFSMIGMNASALARRASRLVSFSCTMRTTPRTSPSSKGGSVASASMVTCERSPAVRDRMNSARPPISALMKMKMNTPTATPNTSSDVWALLAVR